MNSPFTIEELDTALRLTVSRNNSAVQEWLEALKRWTESFPSRVVTIEKLDELNEALKSTATASATMVSPRNSLSELLAELMDLWPEVNKLRNIEREVKRTRLGTVERDRVELAMWQELAAQGLQSAADLPSRLNPSRLTNLMKIEALMKLVKKNAGLVHKFYCGTKFDPSEDMLEKLRNLLLGVLERFRSLKTSALAQAKRLRYAPVAVTASFGQWVLSTEQENGRIADQSTTTKGKLEDARDQYHVHGSVLLSDILLKLIESESDISNLVEKRTQIAEAMQEIRSSLGILEDDSIASLLRAWVVKLKIAQASMPTFPEDWTKPAGDLLIVYVICVASFVLIGSVIVGQPLWMVFSPGDAGNLAFNPVYIVSVLVLVWLSVRAVRALPKVFAERCFEELQAKLSGSSFSVDESLIITKFEKSMRLARLAASVIAVGGMLILWAVVGCAGNQASNAATGGSRECNSSRYFVMEKAIVVWAKRGEGATFPTTEGMDLLCPKHEIAKESSEPRAAPAALPEPASSGSVTIVDNGSSIRERADTSELASATRLLASSVNRLHPTEAQVHLTLPSVVTVKLDGCPFDVSTGCAIGDALVRIADGLQKSGPIGTALSEIKTNTNNAATSAQHLETNFESWRSRKFGDRVDETLHGKKTTSSTPGGG